MIEKLKTLSYKARDILVKNSGIHPISPQEMTIDLMVRPHFIQLVNQAELLKEYKFPNLSTQSNLHDYLKTPRDDFNQKVFQSYLPENANVFQFKGGVISLIFSPSQLSPRTSSMQLEGNEDLITLRYRRYFRLNRKGDLDLQISNDQLHIEMTHFQDSRSPDFYFTVDYFQKMKFTSDKLIEVTSQRIDFIPGIILSSRTHSASNYLLPNIYGSEHIKTGELNIRGSLEEVKFNTQIEFLSFNMTEGDFDLEGSVFNTKFRDLSSSQQSYSPLEQERLRRKLKRTFLVTHKNELIKYFQLDRFAPTKQGLISAGDHL